jgi:hypothetical protein
MKETERWAQLRHEEDIFVSLQTGVVRTEEYNAVFNIGATE